MYAEHTRRDARSGRPSAGGVRAGEFPIRTISIRAISIRAISIRAADAQTGRPYSNHFHYNWMGRNPKLYQWKVEGVVEGLLPPIIPS
jgi:hypothetical protein